MYAKITLTNACNGQCRTCVVPRLGDTRTYMNLGMFCRIVDRLAAAGMECLHMYNIGESYQHPHHALMFEKGIDVFQDRTCIITNGALVDDIPRGVGHFIFSFNGGDRDGYERVTGMSFDGVVANIRRLHAEGQFERARRVEIHMLSCDDNGHNVDGFYNLFEGLGVPLRVSEKVDNQCGRMGATAFTWNRCPCDYLKVLNIHCDGSVVMCAHDFAAETNWGDMLHDPLWHIFLHPERVEKTQEHAQGMFTGLCKLCNYNLLKAPDIRYLK